MPRFRSLKTHLRALLASAEWEEHLDDIVALPGKGAVGPLLSCLLLGGEAKWRAVVALGRVVARIADANMEDARIIMRRLMWHMNEESGNIGWGIPEAFGEILACHPRLADEYHRILVSYVRETGKDDNYCDHAPLRRGVYWAIGRLAQERPCLPGFAETAVPALLAGLADCDLPARGTAAWSLGVLSAPEALPACCAPWANWPNAPPSASNPGACRPRATPCPTPTPRVRRRSPARHSPTNNPARLHCEDGRGFFSHTPRLLPLLVAKAGAARKEDFCSPARKASSGRGECIWAYSTRARSEPDVAGGQKSSFRA